MKRSNNPPAWDLSDLYSSIAAKGVVEDGKRAAALVHKFKARYDGKVAKLGAAALAEAIREFEKLSDLMGKLGCYAQLQYAENVSDPKAVRFYQNIQESLSALSTELLFFTLAINRIDEGAIKKMLAHSNLAHYAPWIRDVRAFRKYQLQDDLEKLLHEKDLTGRMAWVRLYDETMAALRFPWGGKKVTQVEITDLMSSPKAVIRKKAGQAFGKVLKDNERIFTQVTNTLAKDKDIEDGWRGYKQPISSRNLSNYVEDEVVAALMDTVSAHYPKLSHRYYKLKAKWLGLKKMHYTDRNAPLPGDTEKRYGWDEAKELVLGAYQAFSPTMAKAAQQFFDKRWIDAALRDGKDSGAFSHPVVPSVHPYILMNFQGKPRDVMTLAHELGHGVHQLFSAKQGALMADTPLTLAETASVFGEMLTFQEMLRRETNVKRKKFLIAHKIEDMLNTVVRQVAFCNFEKHVHDERKQGELSPERLSEIWLKVQSQSLGPAFKFDEEYGIFWSYIPHFIHTPFYVYAYAFGDCLVNSLYAVYQKEAARGQGKAFEKKYIEMLSAGGTLRHKELLKPFGLNAGNPGFWSQGLKVIEGYIDQLEAIA